MNKQIEELVQEGRRLNARADDTFKALDASSKRLGRSIGLLGKQFIRPTVPMLRSMLKVMEGYLEIYEEATSMINGLAIAIDAGTAGLKAHRDEMGALSEEDIKAALSAKNPSTGVN